MNIYILNLLSIGIYSLIFNAIPQNTYTRKKVKSVFIFLITLQLIIILALRHSSVGYDLNTYINFFRAVSVDPGYHIVNHRFEIGYKILNYIISLISGNEQAFVAIISVITLIPIGVIIYRYSKMPFLSYIVLISFNYYAFLFSGLRQGIAYSLVLLSYIFIKESKPFKFIVLVLLTSLFHKSALIFLPAYFIYRIKLTKRRILVYVFINSLIYMLRKPIMSFFINNFYDTFSIVESSSYTWLALSITIVVLAGFTYRRILEQSPDSVGLYSLLLIGISLMLFASVVNNIMRVADYYYIFIILFIPEVLYVLKKNRLILIVGYLVIIAIILIYLRFLYGNLFGNIPYRFFWN